MSESAEMSLPISPARDGSANPSSRPPLDRSPDRLASMFDDVPAETAAANQAGPSRLSLSPSPSPDVLDAQVDAGGISEDGVGETTPRRPRTTGLFLTRSPLQPGEESGDDADELALGGTWRRRRHHEDAYTSGGKKRARTERSRTHKNLEDGEEEGEKSDMVPASMGSKLARLAEARRKALGTSNAEQENDQRFTFEIDDEEAADIQRSALALLAPNGQARGGLDSGTRRSGAGEFAADDAGMPLSPVLKDPLALPLDQNGDETDEAKVGVRPPRAKLDDERLLGDRGLPALMKMAKKFKVKGKGHETEDLNNLISLYQLWAHQMFPKFSFSDAIVKIESLCHSKSVQTTVRRWRDEEERAQRQADRLAADVEAIRREDALAALDKDSRADETIVNDVFSATHTDSAPRQTSTRPAQPIDHGSDDEIDSEELIAMAEADAAQMAATNGHETHNSRGRDDFDDEWAAMDEMLSV